MSYREKAKNVLSGSYISRNSDWVFLFKFFEHEGIAIPEETQDEILSSGLNLRSIMRERQYVQNTLGLYPPMYDVKLNRIKRQREMTEQYK